MQTALQLIFPPRCVSCDDLVAEDFGLCGKCWRETGFIQGLRCDACGVPLPGADTGAAELCDACLAHPRPWARGRAALIYDDNARRLVMRLKYGDRTDLARTAGRWLAQAARPILVPGVLIAPVPLHWTRLFRRRFNQAALLAGALARETGHEICQDLLVRHRRTPPQEGLARAQRLTNLERAIIPHPRRKARAAGKPVLIVDDVMTTGATLSAATEATYAAGATQVCVLTLARVAHDA